MLKLFNTLVLPILVYCSEVWGSYYLRKLNDFNLIDLCEKLPGEDLVLKFCRHVLAVNRKSAKVAVRGELGVFPLLIHTSNNFIKYWERFHRLKQDSFLRNIFQDSVDINVLRGNYLIWNGYLYETFLYENQY